jgi:hypothetical protein
MLYDAYAMLSTFCLRFFFRSLHCTHVPLTSQPPSFSQGFYLQPTRHGHRAESREPRAQSSESREHRAESREDKRNPLLLTFLTQPLSRHRAAMLPPHQSLVQYDNPLQVTSAKKKKSKVCAQLLSVCLCVVYVCVCVSV